MILRATALTLAVLLLAAGGCSTDTELGGVKVPNARPDTRITGQPPTLLEAGFSVEFHWTGSDPDNKVKGFEWKISDNGTSGISRRDTLTVDPLTGAEINPWRFTEATDSLFVVLADLPDFPGDEAGTPRSFRTHSLFVRAVDEADAVDPTPAYMSFTSTTIVPQGAADFPNKSTDRATDVPKTVNIGWEGSDEDFELRIPTKVRYMWRSAVTSNGTTIDLPFYYNQYYEEMVDFADPTYWSDWIAYDAEEENRLTSFPDRDWGEYFLFAVQFKDTAGAVSIGRGYGVEVANLFINRATGPAIEIQEAFLGSDFNFADVKVAAGQPLSFVWRADATSYNGVIETMRHGWDLKNKDDDADPGWMVPPGLSDQNKFSVPRSFQDGQHEFFLRIEDDSRDAKEITIAVTAVPFVPRAAQAEMLVIDQLHDDGSNQWVDQAGQPRDNEEMRNPWWQFLEDGPGGVSGLDWDLDRFDHNESPTVEYADLVGYKAVLCFARSSDGQQMFRQFRSTNGRDIDGNPIKRDKFVWLNPYQERGGNFFLVGGRSMESFLENDPRYMTPIVFDTAEPNYQGGNESFTVSFGVRRLPDGTTIMRGPLQYPYATAGIALLDWTSSSKYIYGRPQAVAHTQRRKECVGIKGLVLDPDFKNHHGVGPSDFRDTILTDSEIDWHDAALYGRGDLSIITNNFPWGVDEFIDANISTRTTDWARQTCDDPAAPGGLCVEPMFRGIARFDWLREFWWSHGQPDWPTEGDPDYWNYGAKALDDTCGSRALISYAIAGTDSIMPRGSARTHGKIFGYFSYKMTEDKPGGSPDVFWGFDPYRFDHDKIQDAIRWVLSRNFELNVNN